MHLQPTVRRVVSVLVAALVLCPAWLGAQQVPVAWPAGVSAPVFVIPASAMNGAGTLTVSCVTFPSGTVLCEDAAQVLAQKNGTNAQVFRLYNTYTDASTYQRWGLDATTSGSFKIGYGLNGAATTYPMTLTSAGQLVTLGRITSGADFYFGNASGLYTTSWGSIRVGATADGTFNFLIHGGATGAGIDVATSNVLKVRTPAQTGYATVDAGGFSNKGTVTISVTSATILSGFGTNPSIVASNGTAAFTINVGTGGAASAGIIGLPTATTGWHVTCDDVTTPASNSTVQTTTSVGSATLTNYSRTLGTVLAWTSGDTLVCSAMAYGG